MIDLSVLVPARNEEFLQKTIDDLTENAEGNIEIIAILDGYLPDPPLKPNPKLIVIYHPESVGQRLATKEAAKLANGKYLMKIDAHCAFDKGFDVKMMADMQDDWTLLPMMKNLHAFDWVCPDGHRRYQGPSGPCQWKFDGKEWVYSETKHNTASDKVCGKPTTKDVVWIVKHNPTSTTYRFDKTMHFQYWKDLEKRQAGELVESLSIQGSCFMCTREKFFELDLCGDEFGSWGQQGVEVACKSWLSGGRVLVTKKTWYAHMFRTQGGDFGFPYHNPQSEVEKNRELSRQLFQHDKWPKATRKFQWLLDKFNPPDWGLTRGIIYYTDNELAKNIAKPCREAIIKASKDKNIPITTAALHRKLDFGVKNIYFPSLKRSYLSMFKQILGALENSSADIIFFCEADVLYHPTHFDFIPPEKDTFYFNQSVWFLRTTDGHALHYDVNQLSGLCVYRDAALTHFRERYEMALAEHERLKAIYPNEEEFLRMFNRFIRNMGFEPFTHHRVQWKNQFKMGTWKSEQPNIDIKHGANATGQRWRKEEYRNQQLLINWTESEDTIPGWPPTRELIKMLQ